MITQDQAVTVASEGLAVDADAVGLHEFEHGWVVWRLGEDDDGLVGILLGAVRGVVDRQGGPMTVWPCLPVELVADRYTAWVGARGRFAPELEQTLLAAGWFAGRHAGTSALGWLEERLGRLDPGSQLLAVEPPAACFVEELGRLELDPVRAGGSRVVLYPAEASSLPGPAWGVGVATLAAVREGVLAPPVCPVGAVVGSGHDRELVMTTSGELHTVSLDVGYGVTCFRVGLDGDAALAALLTGEGDARVAGQVLGPAVRGAARGGRPERAVASALSGLLPRLRRRRA